MLSNNELRAAYLAAYEKGFVSNLVDPAACNSQCKRCPANKACLQMSTGIDGNKSYTVFVKAYRELDLKEV